MIILPAIDIYQGKAVRLVATPESDRWEADGYDLLYVQLRAVDDAGRTVPEAAANVSVKVEGPARLVALDDGDHDTNLLFDVDEKPLRNGRLLAIVRAGRSAGQVKVSFKADGLPPTELSANLAPKKQD